ncbi:unnamed protein product, partial [Menidia menidia]
SPGSGLYDNLQQFDLPYAEAVFELGFFLRDPRPFFALAGALYPGRFRPNAAHHFPAVMGGAVPRCPPCGGVVKPDIVFFGEELPPLFMKSLTDLPLADLLVVMGTSLEVRCMLGNIRGPVRLEINREPFGLPRFF